MEAGGLPEGGGVWAEPLEPLRAGVKQYSARASWRWGLGWPWADPQAAVDAREGLGGY